jgi:molecular chaperone GrpE
MNQKEKKEPIVNEEYLEEDTACDSLNEDSAECCSCGEQEGCCGNEEEYCGCDHGNEDELSTADSVYADLKQKLKEAEDKRDEYLSIAQRTQADFENYKRRNKTAVADAYNSAMADVVEAFLPVLDNLERAIESVPESEENEPILKGIELVKRQFVDTLSRLGVEEIEALGLPFDPEFHHAVGQVDGEEGQEENTVAQVLQKGYKTDSKVIRYSMVHVVR